MKNYGLIGKNIQYSLSPKIYNYLFTKFNILAQYNLIDLSVFNINLIVDLLDNQAYYGLNFTQPYKELIFANLQQTIKSPEIIKIKSVNLLHKNNDQKITLYNSDYYGLTNSYQQLKLGFNNTNILIIGAGGVCRALIYSLQAQLANMNIFLINRTQEKIFNIKTDFNDIQFYDNELIDIIFNATNLSFSEVLELYQPVFNKKTIFYDLNYKYKENFINNYYINGKLMLINQALFNFYIWYGIRYNSIDFDKLLKLVN